MIAAELYDDVIEANEDYETAHLVTAIHSLSWQR
jgi:hypothetical protein